MVPVRWIFVVSLMGAAASLLGGCRMLASPTTPVVPAALTAPAGTAAAPANAPVAAIQQIANKLVLQRLATAWNKQDYAAIGAMLGEGAAISNPGLPDLHDAESYVERARTVHAVIPNYQLTYDDVLAEGDQVLARETFTGKIGPTAFTYTGMLLVALKDGKIVDLYEISDELAVRKFLGDVPNDQKNANFGWQGGAGKAPAGAGDLLLNKETVRQWWEGDAAAQEALAAPDFTYHNPWAGAERTYGDRVRVMQEIEAALGDLKFEVVGPMVAENDKVGFRFTLAGEGLALPGIALYRVANGKVAEEWILWANTALYSALNSK